MKHRVPSVSLRREAIGRVSIVVALLAYGLIVDPETGQRGIPCLWKALFGFECPGCGLSRAGALLVRGRFAEAVHTNWLIFPFVLVWGHTALTRHVPSFLKTWRIPRWQS